MNQMQEIRKSIELIEAHLKAVQKTLNELIYDLEEDALLDEMKKVDENLTGLDENLTGVDESDDYDGWDDWQGNDAGI